MSEVRKRVIAMTTRVLVCVVVLATAGWVYHVLVATAPRAQSNETPPNIRRVTVFPVKKLPIRRQWSGYGTTVASDSAEVPARVTATVVSIPEAVIAGRLVKRGQLLIQLDDSDLRQQVEIARQNLKDLQAQLALIAVEEKRFTEQLELETQDEALAAQEWRRVEQLHERGAAHTQDVDRSKRSLIAAQRTRVATQETLEKLAPRRRQIQAQYAALSSQLELAKLNLQRCLIVSPIDGVLQSVDVEVGENLAVGQRVARVVDLSRIEVPLRLPAAARSGVSGVAVGDPVELTATNRSGLAWSGHVARIVPENDPETRTLTVFVEIDQSRLVGNYARGGSVALFTPGMFLAGTVTSGHVESRWVVPRRSISRGRIMLVDSGVIASCPVRVDYVLKSRFPESGVPDEQWAVLETPLNEGLLVVVNASTSVLDGQAVESVIAAPPEDKTEQAVNSNEHPLRPEILPSGPKKGGDSRRALP